MANSRIESSAKNMKFGMMYQVIYLLLNFVVRFSILSVLGVTALSLNGLFTEVLGILSLAEMGVGTAITYYLYKPLAEDDEKRVTQLMNLFKKAYHIIALVMLAVGLALIPVIPYIVTKVEVENSYLILIYVLFLLQTVVSYVNSYKALLLTADQKSWVQAKINIIVRALFFGGSLIIIYFFKNFVLYAINEALYNLIFYFVVGKKVDQLYPYLKNGDKLSKEDTHEVITTVRQAFVGKFSNKVLNSTDNILISTLVGTNLVGVYSQYSMFINGFLRVFSQINESVVGSVGNSIASESKEKNRETFNRLTYLFFVLGSFCSICLFVAINPFLTGIVGKNYLLDDSILIMITINMFLETFKMPLWTYFDAAGLFNYNQRISFIGCIINIVTSVIFGKMWGMFGIFLGTFLSLMYMFVQKIIILEKAHFGNATKDLIRGCFKYFSIFAVELIISMIVCRFELSNAILEFVVKGIIGAVITIVLSGVLFSKTDEFKYLKYLGNRTINKLMKR